MAWKEYFVYGINFTSITAGDGTSFTPGIIRIDSDSDFEFQKITYYATNGNIRIRMRDDSAGRYIVKDPVDLRSIGSEFVGTPFIWPRPHQILAGSAFTVEVADASGQTNSLRFYMHGAKIRPGSPPYGVYDEVQKRVIWKKFAAIIPSVATTGEMIISANSNSYGRIEVDNDANFLVMKITGTSTGNCLVEFKEAVRNRDWQNIAVISPCIFGNGQFPNILYSERFVPRGSVITVNVQNLMDSQNVVSINLIGVKLYE